MYKVTLPNTGEELEMTKPEFMAYHLALKQNLSVTAANESKLPSPRMNETIPPAKTVLKSPHVEPADFDQIEKSVKTAKKDTANISAV
jgi:hypothetical protein